MKTAACVMFWLANWVTIGIGLIGLSSGDLTLGAVIGLAAMLCAHHMHAEEHHK